MKSTNPQGSLTKDLTQTLSSQNEGMAESRQGLPGSECAPSLLLPSSLTSSLCCTNYSPSPAISLLNLFPQRLQWTSQWGDSCGSTLLFGQKPIVMRLGQCWGQPLDFLTTDDFLVGPVLESLKIFSFVTMALCEP